MNKVPPKYLKVLCCELFNDFLRENIPEDDYYEVNSKFFQCPHKIEEHEHVFVPCNRWHFNFTYPNDHDFYAHPNRKCFCQKKTKDQKRIYCIRLKSGF